VRNRIPRQAMEDTTNDTLETKPALCSALTRVNAFRSMTVMKSTIPNFFDFFNHEKS
jgi:hypothetical protein